MNDISQNIQLVTDLQYTQIALQEEKGNVDFSQCRR